MATLALSLSVEIFIILPSILAMFATCAVSCAIGLVDMIATVFSAIVAADLSCCSVFGS